MNARVWFAYCQRLNANRRAREAAEAREKREREVLAELRKLREILEANSVDLTSKQAEVLNKNLWNLYE